MFVGRTFSPAIGVAQSASVVSSHAFGIVGAADTVPPMWRFGAKMADVHSATRTRNVRICCMAVLTDWIRLIDAMARTDEEVAHAGDPSSEQIMYYTSFMSMGKRTRDWQSAMWVPITELPRAIPSTDV